uniref:ADP-ribosylation factor-like protein 6-interacting protein 1 n=1 Tax=Hirondellea gigas TaxID=1518452 RepID=A0A2P2I962_9CRUS
MEVSNSQEKRAKSLRRELEGWREVLVACHSLLSWDKPYYPAIIFSATSVVFLLIWYLDPSLLTLLSLFGLLITLADYLVPQIASLVFGGQSWTGAEERRYEQVVSWIACAAGGFCCSAKTFTTFKANRPKMYFMCVSGVLLTTAWLGSSLNNFFLTYCIVLSVLLLPGLRKQGVIRRQVAVLGSFVSGFIGSRESSPAPQDKKKQ